MKDVMLDPRQQAILEAAWECFATYGYRKTSMDDIARKAGMSRPALYLHYKNKDDIYRSLVGVYYEMTALAVSEALNDEGTVQDVLMAAFMAQGGEQMEAMLTSPHGSELLDVTKTAAAEEVAQGEARLAKLYAAWIEKMTDEGKVAAPCDPELTATTMMAALKGMKTGIVDYAFYRQGVACLAALIGAGLCKPS